MRCRNRNIVCALRLLVGLLCVTSCSTGIESTKTIKMSRSDERDARPTAEDELASEIQSSPTATWARGKKFLVTDDRAAVVLELPARLASGGSRPSLAGRTLKYERTSMRTTPGGDRRGVLEFSDADGVYCYATGFDADKTGMMTGLDLPMMIDLDMVESADSLLRGKRLWTLSRLWYDGDGVDMRGRKYVPVTVTSVRPGNMVFPLVVDFTDERGVSASMFMNVTQGREVSSESRRFSSLFSLSDPRRRHQSVTGEFWELICDGKVANGMTKEECRLSLGNPSDSDSGHSWNFLLDVWSYKDGTYLQFQDGLLVNYR